MRRALIGLLKVITVAVLLAVVLLYVLVNHSALTQELTCKGHWKDKEVPEVAHVRLTEYRWWVHLWANRDGDVQVQTEKLAMLSYLPYVQKIGEGSLAMYAFRDREDGSMQGGYRVANGEMTIRFTDGSVFIGKCGPRGK